MNSENESHEDIKKQIKSKVDFENIKSEYFLQRIFNYLKKNKSLKIAKYSKKLQKKLNLSINSYKEFSELYSSIEIELKLAYDFSVNFINIPDKNREYYHIYFDNSNKEIKRNYLVITDKVEIIKIIIDYQVLSFRELFANCKHFSSIIFKKFDRINITDMSFMFAKCSLLKELNLSNFHTDNVTDMSYMFYGCKSLKELNLSNFNTNNVIYMNQMFRECSSLIKLNLSNFNTNNVTVMTCMFYECKSLKELNLSNFKVNKETNMYLMFEGCSDELKKKIKIQNKDIEI